jgi:O-methyltransferase
VDIDFINNIVTEVRKNKVTMVSEPLFQTTIRNYYNINSIQGDIVECGVWRGGYSVFLSHLFKDRTIWVCDSFEGFQSLKDAKYNKLTYSDPINGLTERFQKGNNMGMDVSLLDVQNVFKQFNLENDPRINFVKGFVNKTLPNININKIALLRIDVDGYSPTREVLDYLYNKVEKGGMIIFDDLCLSEAAAAVKDWMIEKNIPLEVHNPYNDKIYSLNEVVTQSESGYYTGSYIIKK